MNGWIKLYRELITKAVWKKNTVEGRNVLIAILCMAYHEPSEWVWKGEKYKTVPGQFVTSLQNLAEAAGSGVSIQNVRTAIAFLEKAGFLTNEPTNHGRLITITNWASYQSIEKNQQANQQTGNKRLTTKEEEKNNKKITLSEDKAQSAQHPIWGDGLQVLMEQGDKESSARSFLGRALKEYGEGALNEAISACVLQQPVNAKAFMIACLNSKPKKQQAKPQSKYCALPGNQIVPTEQRTGGIIEW